jgi:arylsulfatase A-like enzyme
MEKGKILSLAARGALLGFATGLLFGGAEIFFSSLFSEIYGFSYLFMILLYAGAASIMGAALCIALPKVENFFISARDVTSITAFRFSIFLIGFIFLYAFYFLNEKVLAGKSLFAVSSIIASFVLLALCGVLAFIFYHLSKKREFSPWFWSYGAMAALPIILLVGVTYHIFGWGAPSMGFFSVAMNMLMFVSVPLLGFLIEHVGCRLLPAKLQTSTGGAMAKVAIFAILGLGGMALLGPPSLNGYDAANDPPTREQMASLTGRPNLIWIVIDTARRDRLSLYGYHRQTTPNLDAFAKEAVVFNRAISAAPWTVPSHGSMFTGMYPSKHGAQHSGRRVHSDPLAQANLTIAEILSGVGYKTACIAANNAGLSPGFGLNQGFEMYFEAMPAIKSLFWGKLIESLPEDFKNNRLRHNEIRLSSELNFFIGRWLDKHAGDQFFLFINYMEPHGGYNHIPQPYDTLFGFRRETHDEVFAGFDPVKVMRKEVAIIPAQRQFYDAYTDRKIVYMDHHIGRLFEDLKKRKLYDEAMIIVVADHGNLDGEHYSFGHNTELYDILIHVPLIIKYPKSMQRAGAVDHYVSTIDLMPEILKVCGLPITEDLQGQPVDEVTHEIMAELTEQKNNAHAKLNPERYYRNLRAIYSNDGENLKYIQSSNGESELYNLEADPGELNNLITQRPEKVQELEARLKKWLESFEPVRDDEQTKVTNTGKLIERLRALGYVK